ncbi:MAG: hypothetical protein IJG60_03280 [Thermoguttaceae bacterium]|nr:hypothetical protein [Thermoguttaceae bacterium]
MKFKADAVLLLLLLLGLGGCGTTKFSDTARTATEQLLISSAMEDAVDEFNLYPLSGRKVFMKTDGVSATDKEYLLTLLRQQLAANGVLLQEKQEDADYILEVATGTVGTDRYELIYGTKETSIPSFLTMGAASAVPEIALIKRTDQQAKVKLMMWAYNIKTGAIVWQSGQKNSTSSVRDRWVLGIGPIRKSSFSDTTQIAGDDVPPEMRFGERVARDDHPTVRSEAVYRELDQAALDRLEEIRKAGFDMMTLVAEEEPAEGTSEPAAETEAPAGEPAKEEEPAPPEAPAETSEAPAPKALPALHFDDDFTLSAGETRTISQ